VLLKLFHCIFCPAELQYQALLYASPVGRILSRSCLDAWFGALSTHNFTITLHSGTTRLLPTTPASYNSRPQTNTLLIPKSLLLAISRELTPPLFRSTVTLIPYGNTHFGGAIVVLFTFAVSCGPFTVFDLVDESKSFLSYSPPARDTLCTDIHRYNSTKRNALKPTAADCPIPSHADLPGYAEVHE
jgi:hypothetical protein